MADNVAYESEDTRSVSSQLSKAGSVKDGSRKSSLTSNHNKGDHHIKADAEKQLDAETKQDEKMKEESPPTDTDLSDLSSIASSNEIPAAYPGMPIEVLLHYSRQKKYLWSRNVLSIIVILTILTLLALVIALIAVSPACQQFWQTSPIYQIYPKSFYDASNDGIGDLQGIVAKLSHLQDLGVTTIWLNPIYNSSQEIEHGYAITDYRSIDPLYGDLDDLEELATQLHSQAMKLVMDFVPNHTSDKHEWFIASSDPSHEDHEKYKDYYVWVNGTENNPPNNWQSVYSDQGETSAWEYNADRRQYYYHAFYKEQPDLNLRNPAVVQELKGILEFWVDNNVDGFHVEGAQFLFEATHLRNNPKKNEQQPDSYANLWPDHTENQIEIHDVMAEWGSLMKKYSSEPGIYRFLETEINDTVDVTMRYYGSNGVKEADFPMNFELVNLATPNSWTATAIEEIVLEWMDKMPDKKWPNWLIGTDNTARVVSRLGPSKARLAAVLTMSLSGTPGIYYGEEIGMTDGDGQSSEFQDDRNSYRNPMQWDSSVHSGFCSNCTPWISVNEDRDNSTNVQSQAENSNFTSMMCLYKKLISMRSEVLFSHGYLCVLNSESNIFMYVREISGSRLSTLVVINFGSSSATIDVRKNYPYNLPTTGTVIFKSSSCEDFGESVFLDELTIEAEEALMIHFNPPQGSELFSKSSSISQRCFVSNKVCINIMALLEVC